MDLRLELENLKATVERSQQESERVLLGAFQALTLHVHNIFGCTSAISQWSFQGKSRK